MTINWAQCIDNARKGTYNFHTDTKVVPIESVLGLGLEEVDQEEKLIRGRVHQVLQDGAQQHFERKALVFGLSHVHQNGLPLNLRSGENGGKSKGQSQSVVTPIFVIS